MTKVTTRSASAPVEGSVSDLGFRELSDQERMCRRCAQDEATYSWPSRTQRCSGGGAQDGGERISS
jgi:hypothetical protein